jgi:hypothetical protein
MFLGWRSFRAVADVKIKPFLIREAVLSLCRRSNGDGSFDTILLLYSFGGTAYLVALLCTKRFSEVELSMVKEGLGFMGSYLRSWNQEPEIHP